MAAKKGNKTGRQFSKTHQPAKQGRKPTRMSEFIKAFKMDDESRAISKEDAVKLLTHLLSCSKPQLEIMARNPDLPVAIVCQIKAIITDMANGVTSTVDRIFDRVWGKATTPIEMTGANGTQLIPDRPMSRKDYEKLLNDLKCGA